ncbi:MAG: hypothetical protein HY200_04995 [Nitrospirae bacterium]|nr:hypothetical protein [Nitrospirota bacterium]MBI3594295.1 hypothetical protein [Nitrospirota bacterium]
MKWLPINASIEEWKTFDGGRETMKQGWDGSLDQLEKYVEHLEKSK